MITPQQAKDEYGFVDASEREDNLTLGLYQAAQSLFPNKGMLFVDRSTPIVICLIILGFLVGMLRFGVSYYAMLLPVALCFVFVPTFIKNNDLRSKNSGMCHIENLLGRHFLIARGVCVEKKEVKVRRKTVYRLKVRLAKKTMLDDVIIMKDLYEQVAEGTSVCVMMADNPAADQIIAAPANFLEMTVDKKRVGLKLFELVDPRLTRILSDEERAMYAAQYQQQIALWRKTYLRTYAILCAIGLFFILLAGYLQNYNMQGLAAGLFFCVILMYLFHTVEFRNHLKYIQTAESLTAVDATVSREAGYSPENGVKKTADACVLFKDSTGAILWTSRVAEDLKIFAPHDKALLIIQGKVLLPFLRDTETLPER